MAFLKKIRIYPIILGIVLFSLDFATKYLTQRMIPLMQGDIYPYGGIGVFKNFFGIEFSIVHATNRGAAWGLFSDYQLQLVFLRMIFIFCLMIYLFFFNQKEKLFIPLTLICFGALGNIVDYFIYGHVVDMFYFVLWGYSYPVFNIADAAICIGIFWLLISSWFDS